MLAASSQPPGTDIGVRWQPYLVSLRGQLSMVAYRQPVLLDVNVLDKDAAVGEMVGACVSPELVGAGVGACVVAAQAGASAGPRRCTSTHIHTSKQAACMVTQSEFVFAPQTQIAHVGSERARYMHAAHSSLLDCADWRSVCVSDCESAP